jgi:hypothetical protein
VEQGLARELVNRWVLYTCYLSVTCSNDEHGDSEVLVVLDLAQQDDLVEQGWHASWSTGGRCMYFTC